MPDKPKSPVAHAEAYQQDRLYRIAKTIGDLIPDAMTMAILLMVVLAIAALWIGNTVLEVMDAYYIGLWMLLPFTMQMTLILVLGSTLASNQILRPSDPHSFQPPPKRRADDRSLDGNHLLPRVLLLGTEPCPGSSRRGELCPSVRAKGSSRGFPVPAVVQRGSGSDLAIRVFGQRAFDDEHSRPLS